MGKRFADSLIEGEKDTITVGLIGDLGAGKTTFVQGFAEGLGITSRVISPTFILMRKFEIPKGRFKNLYHVDLYRLEENIEKEVINLGINDIWEKPGNVLFVEWAEKIDSIIPNNSYEISFKIISEEEREISIKKRNG